MTTPLKPAPRQSLVGARLRKHSDYQRAYAASRKRQSASMSWFLAPHPNEQKSLAGDPGAPQPIVAEALTGPRVGLTAGKVLGKAHERNRIKRRMKEALRRHLDLLPSGCDLILHPRRTVLTVDFRKLEAEIVRILKQAIVEQQATVEAARMKLNPNSPATPQVP